MGSLGSPAAMPGGAPSSPTTAVDPAWEAAQRSLQPDLSTSWELAQQSMQVSWWRVMGSRVGVWAVGGRVGRWAGWWLVGASTAERAGEKHWQALTITDNY